MLPQSILIFILILSPEGSFVSKIYLISEIYPTTNELYENHACYTHTATSTLY